MDSRYGEELLQGKTANLFLKRTFDIFVSFLGLLVLSPFLLLIAILIKVDSKGDIMFCQIRTGRWQKPFKIYKFRTMYTQKNGLSITVDGDSRITKTGAFLRKCKIDEFPQFINVFIGDMSFVGPRPEVPEFVSNYKPEQLNVFCVRPGITSPASIAFSNENEILSRYTDPQYAYIHEIMPKKLEMDLNYIKNISFLNDIKILLNTFLKIFHLY